MSIIQRQFGRLQWQLSPILSDISVVRRTQRLDWINEDSMALAKCRST